MKRIACYVPDEIYNFIEDLAGTKDISKAWIIRRLLDHAILEHKKGNFKL